MRKQFANNTFCGMLYDDNGLIKKTSTTMCGNQVFKSIQE